MGLKRAAERQEWHSTAERVERVMDIFDFKAVIFDMDGLLLDTEAISMRIFFEVCAELDVEIDLETKLGAIGRSGPATKAYLAPFMGGEDVFDAVAEKWDERYYAEAVEKAVSLKNGVMALLRWLHSAEFPLAVATSTSSKSAPKKLSNAGIDHFFPIVVTGDQVTNSKPAPDIYRLAAKNLGVDPADCLVFEDSANGVRAGVAAGMTVIQVPDLVPVSAEIRALGHTIVDSLHDALMLLRGFNPAALTVDPLTQADCPAVLSLIELCFPEMDADDQYDIDELEELAEIFPEGAPVVKYAGKPIGFALGIFTDLDFDNMPIDEPTLLGELGDSNHRSDGDYYWGSDIGVHPEWRGFGIGRKIYDARKALVQQYNKKGFAAAGVLPGYAEQREIPIHSYVEQVVAGDLHDPTLSAQLRNGFSVMRLLKDYYNFPPSDNWSTLLLWENPDYCL